ncbi:MAG TPA: hypothetical protein VI168_08350 [Croceibacterium sp.]
MTGYRNALCWAGAILGVALAGMFEVIDRASMTTLLIALPVVAWMALRGRLYCPLGRGA